MLVSFFLVLFVSLFVVYCKSRNCISASEWPPELELALYHSEHSRDFLSQKWPNAGHSQSVSGWPNKALKQNKNGVYTYVMRFLIQLKTLLWSQKPSFEKFIGALYPLGILINAVDINTLVGISTLNCVCCNGRLRVGLSSFWDGCFPQMNCLPWWCVVAALSWSGLA